MAYSNLELAEVFIKTGELDDALDALDHPDLGRADPDDGSDPTTECRAPGSDLVAPLDQEVRKVIEVFPMVKVRGLKDPPDQLLVGALVDDVQEIGDQRIAERIGLRAG